MNALPEADAGRDLDFNRALPALMYLTTAYPSVSHTFIRREIVELERSGYAITRVAIRRGEALVDDEDRREQERTLNLLAMPVPWLLTRILQGLLASGLKFFTAVRCAARLSRASDRGLVRHLAYLLEACAVLSISRRENIEHIHVHFGTNAAAVALLVRKLGGPTYSLTVHGPDEFDAPYGFSLGWKIREAAFTVAISSYCRAQLQRWVTHEHWRRIHVVRCAVGEEWFAGAAPIPEGARDLVCVGRLSEQKGQFHLVEAFAAAVNRGLEGDLILIGDGPLRRSLESRVEELGLRQRVEFCGWRDADFIRERLLQSRALVLPSFAEGLPVVIMEAMALMRPVVSSRITGIPELVEHGRSGWLTIPADTEDLTRALLLVGRAETVELRDLGAYGQSVVRSRHRTEVEAARLSSLFQHYVHAREPSDLTCTR